MKGFSVKKSVIILLGFLAVVGFAAAVKKVHTIDAKLCTNCSECEKACPEDAIYQAVVNGKKVRVIDPKLCTNCGVCVKVCPEDCISETPYDSAVKQKLPPKAAGKAPAAKK